MLDKTIKFIEKQAGTNTKAMHKRIFALESLKKELDAILKISRELHKQTGPIFFSVAASVKKVDELRKEFDKHKKEFDELKKKK